MLKILLPEPESFNEKCQAILKKIGDLTAKRMTRNQLLKVIKDYDILVIRLKTTVDKKLVDRAKRLKIIATATTGTDHIDEKYAKIKKIKIVSLKGEDEFLKNVNASTEHVFALLLSLIRKVPWCFEYIKKGYWEKDRFFGTELFGKTIGIVGFGRIGRKVARLSLAFGMKVLAYDPYVNYDEIRNNGVNLVDFKKLLENSDIILVSVSLTPETIKMFSIKEFRLMKKKPYFINISRGQVVDERALLKALKENMIRGAALDVIDKETKCENPIKNNPLRMYAIKHDNLLITSHIAGSTLESMEMTGIFIANKIKELLEQSSINT